MTDGWIRALVEAIHSSHTQTVLYLSGGASQALGLLMSIPGASNTILEVVVPYSRISMTELLGKIPTSFTSQQTAEEMALLAYNRALKLSRPGLPAVGVGFTGSLASLHPKRGDHRFYLSTRTSDRLWISNVTLSKGLRTREQEDRVSSHLLLKTLADACKVSATYVSELTDSELPDESEKLFDEDQELQQLIDGEICMKVYPFSSETHTSNSERKVILSGSFNPLHDGHLKLLEVASSICGDGIPCFEISAINADKPPLTVSQIKDRVKQFEKVGKPKYYGGDHEKMLEILTGCKRSGCTFLVGGRDIDGVFKVLEDFDLPLELRDLFISIPEERFRIDISSTEVRKSQGL
ncbi:nucleotidylyl transferase superfamily protein isoform X3 [Tasmannia lanceolata]|uniref:nucleotidylyl transferase superfamily protein isoform X3 n=1 Tax=Tasmannia lanceolata TaxID=3420 RepID=UPI004063AF13